MVKALVLALLAFFLCDNAQGEVFTAMADMEALLGAERQVTGVIDQYIEYEKNRLARLREFAAEYEKKNSDAMRDGAQYVSNPINSYILIKRLTSDWSYVESLMKNNLADEFLRNITLSRENNIVKFPDEEDLNGAATALLRLQDVYRLTTADMADGRIQGVKRADELSAHDCFELGRVAYNAADYYHTLLWMTESLDRLRHEKTASVEESEILEYLSFALYQQGNIRRALSMTKRLFHLKPDHPRAAGNIKYYEDEMAKEGLKKGDDRDLPPVSNLRPHDGNIPEREMYEKLCRGETFISEKDKLKLYCYLKSDKPFLRLAPIKVEIVYQKPLMVLFRNVISDYEMSIVKELALPKLQRATVHNKATGKLEHASYRISKSAWLKGTDHPVIARINQRLDDMTNLEMETAEELQIANYGLGGHYDPHFDFARVANYGLGGHYEPHFDMSTRGESDPYRDNTGNRIATVLFYMTAPDAGGATVFPELKVGIFPTTGDAAFWYNLHRDGEGDLTTRHAACPVLSGVKWVSNKWVHERGQEFRRPCALTEEINESFVGEL